MSLPTSPVIDLSRVRSVCQQCGIYRLCLPMGLNKEDLNQLDEIINRRRPLSKGEHLFRAGDPFIAVYALRSGSVKSYFNHASGTEHVIGFKLPGDLIGLSGINGGHYTHSAVALETTSACEIPFGQLESLSQHIPDLQHHILEMMSKEIQDDHEKISVCNKLTAEARLASVLITLSERFQQRGFSATEFHLSMSRGDIANMLGLAVETVSRLFSQFEERGLLKVDRKHIQIINLPGLAGLVAGGEP